MIISDEEYLNLYKMDKEITWRNSKKYFLRIMRMNNEYTRIN